MRNKAVNIPHRSMWFSIVILLFFSITEANEEWLDDEYGRNLFVVPSGYYPEDIFFEDMPSQDFESCDEDDNTNIHLKKLSKGTQKAESRDSYKEKIKPYLIPKNHPAKEALDFIFTRSRPTSDLDAMVDAGFDIVSVRPYSFAVIAKHSDIPGYIEKVYLDSEKRKKNGKEGWEWLVHRCEGAENIRKLIREKKLNFFSVPDKWIYVLPKSARQNEKMNSQPIILLATDMHLVSQEESEQAWKTIITKAHLDELYIILSHGFASSHVSWNIPYSESGKFTCIDTEHPKRKPNYAEVENYLSNEMKAYWKKLVNEGEKKATKQLPKKSRRRY